MRATANPGHHCVQRTRRTAPRGTRLLVIEPSINKLHLRPSCRTNKRIDTPCYRQNKFKYTCICIHFCYWYHHLYNQSKLIFTWYKNSRIHWVFIKPYEYAQRNILIRVNSCNKLYNKQASTRFICQEAFKYSQAVKRVVFCF